MDTTRRLAKEKVEARELQAKKQKLDETEKHNRGLQAAMLRQEGSKLLRKAQQTQEAIVQSSIIGSMGNDILISINFTNNFAQFFRCTQIQRSHIDCYLV